MILTNCHSNLVILHDGIQANIQNIYFLSLLAAKKAVEVLKIENKEERMTSIIEAIGLKNQQKYSEMSFILMSTFYLESLINFFDYTQNFESSEYSFENFSKKSTVKKWKKYLMDEDLINEIKDLFSYRNFLVHSKPIRRTDEGVNEVYVRHTGWTKVEEISTLIGDNMGLQLGNFEVSKLSKVCSIVNRAVTKIEEINRDFSLHYKLKINMNDCFKDILKNNREFELNEKKLNEKFSQ